MGNCMEACLEGPPDHRRPPPMHPGAGFPTSPDRSRPPTFHHPQFRHLNDERYVVVEEDQRGGGGNRVVSGEATRISQQHETPQQQRQPRDWPGTQQRNPPQQRTPAAGGGVGVAPTHNDLQTVVVRQGTADKSQLIRTPRSALTGKSTAAAAGGGATTPRVGRSTTPRAGARPVANDPYAAANDGDDNGSCGDPDEMVLVCADCLCDIMAVEEGRAPSRCQVTGKMHV